MNYLNGGYTMVKSTASQSELAKAYESKKPVIIYDENNIGYFATIKKIGSIYAVKSISNTLVKKVYHVEGEDGDGAVDFKFIAITDSDKTITTKAELVSATGILLQYECDFGGHTFDVMSGMVNDGSISVVAKNEDAVESIWYTLNDLIESELTITDITENY